MDRPGGLGAIGDTPVVRLEPARRAGHGRGVGQARGGQPDRLVQGPDGAGDDRGRRAVRAAAPGPDRRRVHRRLDRQLARLRLLDQGLPAPDRQLRRVRRREDQDDAGVRRRGRADPEPRGHHARPSSRDAGARRGDRRRDRRLTRPTSSTTPTWSRATGRSARSCSSSSTVASTRSCIYVGTAGCYLGSHARPARAPAGDPPRRGRAGRVGGAVRPPGRDPPDRGRRHRVRAPAALARRGRRDHRRLDRRCVRDGPPGGPRGGRLVGTVDRRQHHRRPGRRAPARRGRAGRHDPGQFRAQVPRPASSTPERASSGRSPGSPNGRGSPP